MNSTTPITIAIPGEKRNWQQVKQFLLEQKLIQKDDMNLEVISASRIGVRFVQMRANNALNFLENNQRSSRTIRPLDGAICWIDQMIESLRYDTIMDEDTLVWFSQDEYEDGRDDPIETGNKIKVYDMPFVLDSESSTKIQAFVRQDQLERFPTIESLWMRKKRWKWIATPYPNLAETLLRPLENIESEDPRMSDRSSMMKNWISCLNMILWCWYWCRWYWRDNKKKLTCIYRNFVWIISCWDILSGKTRTR